MSPRRIAPPRRAAVVYGQPVCPTDPEHGNLLSLDKSRERKWYCPHSFHTSTGDGSQAVWSDEELGDG